MAGVVAENNATYGRRIPLLVPPPLREKFVRLLLDFPGRALRLRLMILECLRASRSLSFVVIGRVDVIDSKFTLVSLWS